MPGRCGCGGSCSCELEVKPPLTKEGTGTPAIDPWVLGVDEAALVRDVAGPGLVYDEATGKLQVKLSRDAGNATRFGSDQGIYTPGGEAPDPSVCMRTIDSLPEAPGVVGADTLAGLHNPYNSPQGLEYCIAHSVDIMGVNVSCTGDDVGALVEYDNGLLHTSRSSVYITQDVRQILSDAFTSTLNYAGNVDEPEPGWPDQDLPRAQRNKAAWDKVGGWYGWGAQRYYNWLLPTFLQRLAGKGVAMLHCHVATDGDIRATESQNVVAAIRGVLQECAQGWAMLAVRDIANATTILNAGMTAVLAPATPARWGETTLPYTVDAVASAGIQWVLLPHYYADEVFTAYRDAGIQVLMWGVTRHVHHQRVEDLGIRGGYSLDPVYYRGPVGGDFPYGYRTASDPWEERHVAVGQLTMATDQRKVSGTQVRGYCEASEQGLILPAGWGGGQSSPAVLCGWECPLTNPTAYTLTWDCKAMGSLPNANTPKMAVLFGADTDADPYLWPDDSELNPDGLPPSQRRMYRAWQRLSGEIGLGKWNEDGTFVELATRTGPAVVTDQWSSYTLQISDAGIVFTRTTGGVDYSVTSDDADYRGSYFFIEKEESLAGADPHPFRAKWRNVIYTATAIA